MKTKKKVIEEYPEYKTLINAVISRVGMDSVGDINKHGIQGGFHGFIYYRDTKKFAYKHRKAIIEMLERDAEAIYGKDDDIVQMVSQFGWFKGEDGESTMDNDDRMDLYCYLAGYQCKEVRIPNLMAWYAAETVCRWFEE